VVHNFPGASQTFPSECLFNISEEFCEQILSDNYNPQSYRRFVEENYSLKDKLAKINCIFTQLEAEINSQKTGPVIQNNIQNFRTERPAFSAGISTPAMGNNGII
jgi:hypothetical protein